MYYIVASSDQAGHPRLRFGTSDSHALSCREGWGSGHLKSWLPPRMPVLDNPKSTVRRSDGKGGSCQLLPMLPHFAGNQAINWQLEAELDRNKASDVHLESSHGPPMVLRHCMSVCTHALRGDACVHVHACGHARPCVCVGASVCEHAYFCVCRACARLRVPVRVFLKQARTRSSARSLRLSISILAQPW